MPHLQINGVTLYYELHGEKNNAAGQSVVFMSGLTGDHNNWVFQIQSLKESYLCLTHDWRDTGQSGASPVENYDLETMAADVAGLMAALGLGQSHIVGLSMGGAVAQHLAFGHPELVKSLTLASSFAERKADQIQLPPKLQTVGNLRHAAALAQHNSLEQLTKLKIPVLVVAGSRDKTTPPDAQRDYAAHIPNARFALIENAGHLVQVEKAGEFNRTISSFFESVA